MRQTESGKSKSESVDKQILSDYNKREVNNTIKKHSRKIQHCYNEFLDTKPKITEGKIHVDWQIQPEGFVETPEIITSNFQSADFENCIKREISSWKFPPTPNRDRNTYAEFTFVFRKQENLSSKPDNAPQLRGTPIGNPL
ncbi:AgmX/PglI C-terminal domain-containing protein [Leptospira ryugenii]|nr:AgmX/PglI C-terminal domain-containing protein [Leptospira ryugenii]